MVMWGMCNVPGMRGGGRVGGALCCPLRPPRTPALCRPALALPHLHAAQASAQPAPRPPASRPTPANRISLSQDPRCRRRSREASET